MLHCCLKISKQAGSKVAMDQLGPQVGVGSTGIKSDRLGSLKKRKKKQLDEIETLNHWKVEMHLKIGPNEVSLTNLYSTHVLVHPCLVI